MNQRPGEGGDAVILQEERRMDNETPYIEDPIALTVRQVAERVNVSRPTVERRIKAGTLASVELGGCRWVLLIDLERFLNWRRHVGWRPLRAVPGLSADGAPPQADDEPLEEYEIDGNGPPEESFPF
jgi:excisionase family DNA binding protein